MKNDIILLKKWNRPIFYAFNPLDYKIKEEEFDVIKNKYNVLNSIGVLKKFTIGRYVLFYSIGDENFALMSGRKIVSCREVSIKEFHILFLYFGFIKINKERFFYTDIRLFAFLSPFLDPLYDELDRLGDDFQGFVEKMKK